MSRNVGVLRSGTGLEAASTRLSELDQKIRYLVDDGMPCRPLSATSVKRCSEARNLLLVARLVTLAALHRTESRGAHYRNDYPVPAAEWQRRQSLTVDQLNAA